jgi:hypothetical protein
MLAERIEVHPVQNHKHAHVRQLAPAVLTMRAYEVYCHIYRPQEAMVTGDCRGGFSVGELLCFLYARSFPKEEWSKRFDEANRGMTVG